ncbi:MAG: recombinase family protein [Eubacterium sp.]|nr:recombinase family protein [Eubacterium sp.]
MSKKVGYARVSSREQNLDRQIIALKQYVPEDMIVTDKASGRDLDRPGYTSLKVGIGKLCKGDTLYVKSLDRLSRNKEDIKKELQYYASIGVRIKVIDLPTTMTDFGEGQEWIVDMVNNILIEVISSVAENERLTIKQRQAEGIAAMRVDSKGRRVSNRTGNPIGRPAVTYPENWDEVILRWREKEITAVKAMEELGMKRTSFYKLVNEEEKAG